jgi:hypothetical protein
MTNKFINSYLEAIKEAKTDNEISSILEALYEDGFEDGHDSLDVPNEKEVRPMSKLFNVAEEAKCGGCLWNGRLFVIADSQKEADKVYKTGHGGLCANCIVNLLGEEEKEIV